MGLIALVTISGQYGKRQARLERQYQARERVLENGVSDPQRRDYATPDSTLVPLWPLAVILVAVMIAAAVMLRRERSRLAPVASTGVAQPQEAS
jgi:peptidoglycan/LPS O-acetylase OafA/YrhL